MRQINLPVGGISMVVIAFVIPNIGLPARPEKPPSFPLRTLRKIAGESSKVANNSILVRLCQLDWIASVIVLGGE